MEAHSSASIRSFDQLGGPRGLPILGSLLQIDPKRFHSILEEWCEQYGSPFRFRFAHRQAIVVSNPAAIADVLRRRPDDFTRIGYTAPLFQEIGAHGVFSAEGDAWRRQRRLVMPAFDPSHLKSYFPSLARVTRRLLDRWLEAARLDNPVPLQADLMRFTVDVTAGLAFGVDVDTLGSEGDEIQQHLNHVFTEVNRRGAIPLPYWRYFKLPRDRAFDRHLAEIHKAIASFTARARARIAANPELRTNPQNLIESLICARDHDGSALTDEDVSGNVFTILLAGEDTTANSLAWMIYLVARSPKDWARLSQEADAMLGQDRTLAGIRQAAALEVTDACISETMRLKPVAPVVALATAKDTIIDGVQVPKGIGVFTASRVASLKEANFQQAVVFDPARWLAGDDARDATKRLMFPFGGGPRLCPGRYLALLEMKMVMSMLARSFERPDVQAEDGLEPREIFNFTMMPGALTMKLKQRVDAFDDSRSMTPSATTEDAS